MTKIIAIVLNAIPILTMIVLIPIIENDYLLTAIYIVIIGIAFVFRRTYDVLAFILGFVLMTIAEYLFISTGVEVFLRNTLLGVMPLWLPFLWGYGYVAMKHIVEIITSNEPTKRRK